MNGIPEQLRTLGAYEVRVIALDQAQGLGIEAQVVALIVHGLDALEREAVIRTNPARRAGTERRAMVRYLAEGVDAEP